jgi:sugar/nucleoside kinase (ribokinase family)
MTSPSRVSCFSYLASVHTLYVDQYPAINYGVDVVGSARFLAGDGPLVAAFLTALGHHATLVSNQVADDPAGLEIRARLHEWGVALAPSPVNTPHTRVNIVVCDAAGNRTWFSGLRGIAAEFASIDLSALVSAPTVYVDCYEVLGEAPRAVVAAAVDAGVDVVLNLGGSPPPRWLETVLDGGRVAVVQTNADEHEHAAANRQLDALRQLDLAELAVATAGRRGAVAAVRGGPTVTAPAIAVDLRQVQGAGAAFSAALIHSRDRGEPLPQCLEFACAAGSLWCGRSADDPLPTGEQIRTLMRR